MKRTSLPNHIKNMKLLETINSHPRDVDITFNEKLHLYTFKKEKSLTSVTTLITSLFPKFDADLVIQRMKCNKKKWESNKYFGLTDEEIKEIWESNGKKASEEGLQLHNDIESYYNKISISNESTEFQYFLQFQAHHNLNMFRTEWAIYNEDLNIAGMIDGVGFNCKREDGVFDISLYDWKRSKEIKRCCSFAKKSIIPLLDLTDTNYNKYALQLNLYKYILHTKYQNLHVSKMILVSLHPNNDSYILFEIPDMSNEIQIIIENWKKKQSL